MPLSFLPSIGVGERGREENVPIAFEARQLSGDCVALRLEFSFNTEKMERTNGKHTALWGYPSSSLDVGAITYASYSSLEVPGLAMMFCGAGQSRTKEDGEEAGERWGVILHGLPF